MKIMSKYLHILLGAVVVALAFACVLQITDMTQSRFLAQEYQNRLNEVSEKSLTLNDPENNLSLSEIERIAESNGFTDGGSVIYVEVSDTEMVVK